MGLSDLSSWLTRRLQARDARQQRDHEGEDELMALLDEASSLSGRGA